MNNVEKTKWEVKNVPLSEWKKIVVPWMKQEKWDIGLNDENHFFNVDPTGFYVGYLDDHPISCFSIVKFNNTYSHLGHYIVLPEFRGKDWGRKTWEACSSYLSLPFSTLDGMPVQEKNYAKWGYKTTHKTSRYQFIKPNFQCDPESLVNVITITPENINLFHDYDKKVSGIDRSALFENWFFGDNRYGYLHVKNDQVTGVIGIRRSDDGYRIGPFYAQDQNVLDDLFFKALDCISEGEKIALDVPETALEMVELLKKINAIELFYTYRMTKGLSLNPNQNLIQAITSLELG